MHIYIYTINREGKETLTNNYTHKSTWAYTNVYHISPLCVCCNLPVLKSVANRGHLRAVLWDADRTMDNNHPRPVAIQAVQSNIGVVGYNGTVNPWWHHQTTSPMNAINDPFWPGNPLQPTESPMDMSMTPSSCWIRASRQQSSFDLTRSCSENPTLRGVLQKRIVALAQRDVINHG